MNAREWHEDRVVSHGGIVGGNIFRVRSGGSVPTVRRLYEYGTTRTPQA